jgi:hypothetical protein
MDEKEIKARGRELALTLLDPVFEQIRLAMEEERQKGMSEAEIRRRFSLVCDKVEREQRGKVDDNIVHEMKLLLQEAALPPNQGPANVQ